MSPCPAPSFQGSPSHCLDAVLRAVPTMPRSARLLPGWGHSVTRTPRPSPRAARTCPYPRKATTLLHNSPTSSPAPPLGNNKVSLVEAASAGSGAGRPGKSRCVPGGGVGTRRGRAVVFPARMRRPDATVAVFSASRGDLPDLEHSPGPGSGSSRTRAREAAHRSGGRGLPVPDQSCCAVRACLKTENISNKTPNQSRTEPLSLSCPPRAEPAPAGGDAASSKPR